MLLAPCLRFAEGKRVETENRQTVLARHLINQYSGEEARKVKLGQEITWIEAHRSLIEATATDPINKP